MVTSASRSEDSVPASIDVVIVGAGFGGMYALYAMRQKGLTAIAFEKGDDVGGVWYWNGYPGARCDIESMQYSYSFSAELQQEWHWSEKFASQPEILAYAKHVADRFDLRRDIVFGTTVESAHYDGNKWQITTDRGHNITARYCVMASGLLSKSRVPPLPGIDAFAGQVIHTGAWPRDGIDLAGRRVAVVGTGSSGIGVIPEIAKVAEHLVVVQRTPQYSVPARNVPMHPEYERWWKNHYPEQRKRARERTKSFTIYDFSTVGAMEVDPFERARVFDERWRKGGVNYLHSFNDIMLNQASNDAAADFVRDRIRETVKDPEVAEALLPDRYPIGSKRPCTDTDYYETFNRPNVTLVDLRSEPLVEITTRGVRTQRREYDVDVIVMATGYDAVTGPLLAIDVQGRDGQLLSDRWADGPLTYLGLMVHGFPNLFTVTGPGSPNVLANLITAIEQHVDWIAESIRYCEDHGVVAIEPTPEAQSAWVAHVAEVADATLYPRANSWYVGANIPGKPRVFLAYAGGVQAYQEKCREVAANGYEGFELSRAPERAPA